MYMHSFVNSHKPENLFKAIFVVVVIVALSVFMCAFVHNKLNCVHMLTGGGGGDSKDEEDDDHMDQHSLAAVHDAVVHVHHHDGHAPQKSDPGMN